jgi:hypothetical protein
MRLRQLRSPRLLGISPVVLALLLLPGMGMAQMNGTRLFETASLSVVFVIAIMSTVLAPIIAVLYSYDTLSTAESGAGFAILLVTVDILWICRKRSILFVDFVVLDRITSAGIVLGLLWVIEISINNFIAPPLPMRDIIDNVFWAVIALSIFILAMVSAYQTESMMHGIKVGAWSGFVSGLLACWMALTLIVFGMHFITQDPLNVAEWALRRAGSNAPTMAAYFAFETFAGAFLHLLVLGLAMGGLLGAIGGFIGKITKKAGSVLGL